MTALVVDASIAVKWLVPEAFADAALGATPVAKRLVWIEDLA